MIEVCRAFKLSPCSVVHSFADCTVQATCADAADSEGTLLGKMRKLWTAHCLLAQTQMAERR